MEAEVSTVPAFKVGLRDQLRARPGLAGVTVVTAELGADTPREALILGNIPDGDETWDVLGNMRREETYRVRWHVWIVKPGAGEDTIVAARDRAFAIAAELARQLRGDPRVNGTVKLAEYKPGAMDEGIHPDGRFCQLDGQVAVTAYLES
jgi:hypothetical protein